VPILNAAACHTPLSAKKLAGIGLTKADRIATHSPELETVAPAWAGFSTKRAHSFARWPRNQDWGLRRSRKPSALPSDRQV